MPTEIFEPGYIYWTTFNILEERAAEKIILMLKKFPLGYVFMIAEYSWEFGGDWTRKISELKE